MSLLVREPGLFTLPVDEGRPGLRHLGLSPGGPADRAAFLLGNALVGNAGSAVALEITLTGPVLEALDPTVCVVFGAPFACSVGGVPLPVGRTFTLRPGDVLRVGGTPHGARGYLCVAGGFGFPRGPGGLLTREPLQGAERLAAPASWAEPRGLPFVAWEVPRHENAVVLRVLDGPQADWFPPGSFYSTVYEVTPASNRMGLRLRGTPVPRRAGELVSEAVAPGAVQVTHDGQPLILGVDGQTIGGYPKIAHVIRADLDLLGQLRPGERVRFVRVSLAEAERAARERAAALEAWLTRLRIAERTPQVEPAS